MNELVKEVPKMKEKFRVKYNDLKDDFLAYLQKTNQMKKWDKMCSIQDWIDVSIERIKVMPFEEYKSMDINQKTYFVIELITYINLIVDSVEGIDHIINDKSSEYYKCLIEQSGIFKLTRKLNGDHDKYLNINKTNCNDKKYFKHIRSAFGQHPINLSIGNTRVFASWTKEDYQDESDLYVSIYVNDPNNGWGHKMHISMEELLNYCKFSFELGILLLDELEKKVDDFKNSLIVERLYKEDDVLSVKIRKIKKGIKDRYYNEEFYYQDLLFIEDGLYNLTIDGFNQERKEYNKLLHEALEEIHEKVRSFSSDDLVILSGIDVPYNEICEHGYKMQKAEAYIDGDERHKDNYQRSCKEISKTLNIDETQIKTFADYRFLKYVLKRRGLKVFLK